MLKKYYTLIFSLLLVTLSLTAHAEQTINALFHSPGDPIIGNPRGEVTIVEFFDYQCMHCSNMAPKLESIIRSNPSVRVVLKDLPIRGPISLYAAEAALAAQMQSKYSELYYALLTTDRDLTEASVMEIAKDQGLNTTKLKKDMNSATVKNQIAQTTQLANFLEIPGTPAIFIGKTDATDTKHILYVPGEMSTSAMQEAIDNLGK